MRSLGVSLVLGVTPLLLGGAPSAVAQRAPPMMSPFRPGMGMPQPRMSPPRMLVPFSLPVAQRAPPMMSPFQPGMGMSQPRMFVPSSFVTASSPPYRMPYGGSGMYAMSSGGYNPYQMNYGGYGSYSPSSYAASQASQSPGVPTADDVEVSGPLNTPPPYRAVIRLRLPQHGCEVWFARPGGR